MLKNQLNNNRSFVQNNQAQRDNKKIIYSDIRNIQAYQGFQLFNSQLPYLNINLKLNQSFPYKILIRSFQFSSLMALYAFGIYFNNFGTIPLTVVQINTWKTMSKMFCGGFVLTAIHTGLQQIFNSVLRNRIEKNLTTYQRIKYQKDHNYYSGFVFSSVLSSIFLSPFVYSFYKYKIKKQLSAISSETINKQFHVQKILRKGSALVRSQKILLFLTLYAIGNDFFINSMRAHYIYDKSLHNENNVKKEDRIGKIFKRKLGPKIESDPALKALYQQKKQEYQNKKQTRQKQNFINSILKARRKPLIQFTHQKDNQENKSQQNL